MIEIHVKPNSLHVDLEVTEYIGGSCPVFEHYNGEYEVIPNTKDQEMETRGKIMDENVIVKKIPTYEVSNDSGTTFIVGGI